jgi:hypothetical protein
MDKASEAAAVTMAEMFKAMITSMQKWGVSSDNIIEGLLAGIDEMVTDHRAANPDFDNKAVMDDYQNFLDKIGELVEAQKAKGEQA